MSESPYEETFRDRIAVNRRNSLFLIACFLAFVTVFGYIIGYAWIGDPVGALFGLGLAFVVGVISGLATYYGGDRMVLAASRAREITHDDAPVLFNVVEEMAIAAGLPMPKIYIIDDSAPNAFATGRDPEHASVAVTSGLLEKLTRNPKALADALQKISDDREVLEVANRATAHLYIVNPIKRFEKRAKGVFSTHPPIEERIQILRSLETGGIPGAAAG